MVKGIEHTAIASPDPQRLAEWYVNLLGFRINYQSAGSRGLFIRAADGTMIEIIEAAGEVGEPSKPGDPGLRHLALTVDDFDDAYQRLQEKGVTFLTEASKKGGVSIVFFRDPEGNILHLLQRETPLP